MSHLSILEPPFEPISHGRLSKDRRPGDRHRCKNRLQAALQEAAALKEDRNGENGGGDQRGAGALKGGLCPCPTCPCPCVPGARSVFGAWCPLCRAQEIRKLKQEELAVRQRCSIEIFRLQREDFTINFGPWSLEATSLPLEPALGARHLEGIFGVFVPSWNLGPS